MSVSAAVFGIKAFIFMFYNRIVISLIKLQTHRLGD